MQGIVQLGVLFMQMAPIALSLAVVDLMVAAIKCALVYKQLVTL